MKKIVLLGLLLAGLLDAALTTPVLAAATTTATDGPERLTRMRRHLRHQTKVRLRQNRHR